MFCSMQLESLQEKVLFLPIQEGPEIGNNTFPDFLWSAAVPIQ